jgi:hypothetical protein
MDMELFNIGSTYLLRTVDCGVWSLKSLDMSSAPVAYQLQRPLETTGLPFQKDWALTLSSLLPHSTLFVSVVQPNQESSNSVFLSQ